jgi:hypothetical protein
VNQYDVSGFNRAIDQLRADFNQGLNRVAGGLRQYSDKQLSSISGRIDELSRVTASMQAKRSGRIWQGRSTMIEDIPGRRVPYVMVVDIPISADTTSVRESSITISQEGPFVAVRRMATFQSALEYQVLTPGGSIARFTGRSFGRYRPIHSVCDVNDSQHNSYGVTSQWWLAAFANPSALAGTELPTGSLGLASNMSSFRTMEFDGRISVINAGSSYPRQNISVPSAFWAAECNTPVALGALDFFERGEVITIRVQPNHVNNAPAGNVDGDAVFPVRSGASPAFGSGGYPFVEGQYDAHEGIAAPGSNQLETPVAAPLTPVIASSDRVTRLPDGILTIAYEGYRIIQPPGVPG